MRTQRQDDHHDAYQSAPFPKLRRALAAMYDAVQRTRKTHGLIEVDVTSVRQRLREREARGGGRLSFTAFIIACLARAVDENKTLNVCRAGGNSLAIFDDVDVATLIERDIAGHRQPIVYIVRGANRKTLREIHREIRAAQATPVERAWQGFQAERWLRPVPMVVFRGLWAIFWWARGHYPRIQKKYGGTVGLTSVGMFGEGGGWGIPLSYHTLDVTLGGIAEQPQVVDGRSAMRESLSMTLSFDHDVVDGAPAARFITRLRELIESGYGLGDEEIEPPVSSATQALPAR